MTSSTDEDSKADTYKPLASGDSPTEEVKPKEPKSEEVQDSTQVREEPMAETDDINVFGDDDSKDDQDWVASQEAIKEEQEMTAKLERDAAEEAKRDALVPEYQELTKAERFEKLKNLLAKSKFYSNYLLDQMNKEDEASKALKDKQLSDRRKKRKSQVDSPLRPSAKKPRKHAGRSFAGQDINDDQPLLLSGGVMRDYQVKGYLWMTSLWENGINGILADEMGLGKTIQTIALFCHMVEMGCQGPFLIVAPLSTIENWKREFNRFAPSLPCKVYHGSKEAREEIRQKDLPVTVDLKEFDSEKQAMTTFVTTYNLAMNDAKVLSRVPWKYIVVDEGHRLKNTNCKLMAELKTYRCSNRLLLTGTPLQNNLDELWSLLNFIMPEIFDDLRVFKSWFNANDMHGSKEAEADRILQQEQQNHILSTLHQILTPFLLRRVKADVDLAIPPKKEVLVYCPMTDKQREFYEATVNKTIRTLVGGASDTPEELQPEKADQFGRGRRAKNAVDYSVFLDQSNAESERAIEKHFQTLEKMQKDWSSSCMTAYGSMSERSDKEVKISMKNSLSMLRKVTNHPYMIEYPLEEDGNHYRIDEELVESCGKLKVLDQILNELGRREARGHKTLIFSQFGQLMLTILGDYLNLRGFKFSRLDGQMEWSERQDNIDRFNNDPDVKIFILSTRAGGLGINLTAADTIIIYDSDWNPQQDLQAQDRAHRIGQTKPVMVYRLVTANTIDEKIVERAAAKRRLEKLVIHQKKFKSQDISGLKTTMEAISPSELLSLLNSKDHAGVVDRKDGMIFSQEELDALLDRSELAWNKQSENPAADTKKPLTSSNKSNTPSKSSSSHVTPNKAFGRNPPARRSSSRKQSTDSPAAAPVEKKPLKTNAFKVIDTEGLNDGGLKSVRSEEN